MNDVNFRSLLLRKYKTYKMNDLDCMVVLLCDELLNLDKTIAINSELLSNYMSTPIDKIDDSLAKLFDCNFIELVIEDGVSKISLANLKMKIFKDFKKDIIIENSMITNTSNSQSNIYEYYVNRIGRQLSPIETNKLLSLMQDGYLITEIKQAIDICKDKNKTSINNVINTCKKVREERLNSENNDAE